MEEIFFSQAISREKARQINPVTLAFLGDAVYALWVRERLVQTDSGSAADFQRASAKILSARGQSAFLDKVLPMLTEEETEIFKRGRNAKKATKSKNATVAEYNRSTGLEAVMGYLYLIGERERLLAIFNQTDESLLKGQALQKVFKP